MVLNSSNRDFNLSPPQRNHRLTFNATNFIIRSSSEIGSLEDEFVVVACGFVDGENSSELVSPSNITVQLQQGMFSFRNTNCLHCDSWTTFI